MITTLVGSPARAARAERGERWPWLLAALDTRCGWCDRELRSCCCLDRPGPPARPLPSVAEFLANLPKWCRDCYGVEPCGCFRGRARESRYRQTLRRKQRARGECATCRRPSTSYICASCGARNAELHRARRRRYVEAGLCQQCGKRPYEPGRVQCRPCLDRLADAARARRARSRTVKMRAAGDGLYRRA